MHTAHLNTVCASVSVATTRCHSHGGSQMNKFEQVSSDHHQMSLAEGGPKMNKFEQVSTDDHQRSLMGGGVPRSDVWGYPTWPFLGRGGTLPCDLSPWCIWCYLALPQQTDAYENITFPQLHLGAVIKTNKIFLINQLIKNDWLQAEFGKGYFVVFCESPKNNNTNIPSNSMTLWRSKIFFLVTNNLSDLFQKEFKYLESYGPASFILL